MPQGIFLRSILVTKIDIFQGNLRFFFLGTLLGFFHPDISLLELICRCFLLGKRDFFRFWHFEIFVTQKSFEIQFFFFLDQVTKIWLFEIFFRFFVFWWPTRQKSTHQNRENPEIIKNLQINSSTHMSGSKNTSRMPKNKKSEISLKKIYFGH